MLRVSIPDGAHKRTFEFNGKSYGQQDAGLFAGGHFPLPFVVNTPAGKPYAKGDYTLDPASFKLGENGKLMLGAIKLLPLSGTSR